MAQHFNSCYGQFSDESEDTRAYGNKNASAWHENWYERQDKFFKVNGELSAYPCGKFSHILAPDSADNAAQMHQLQQGNWIDRATRAVIIEFSIYNANLDMLCFTQYVMEDSSCSHMRTQEKQN